MATAKNYTPGQLLPGDLRNAPQQFVNQATFYQGVTAAGNVPSVAILSGAGTVGSMRVMYS